MDQEKEIKHPKEKYQNLETDHLYPGILTTEIYKNGNLCIDTTPVTNRHQNTCNLASWAFSPVPAISPEHPGTACIGKSAASGIQISNVTSIPVSEYYNTYSPDISYGVSNPSTNTQDWGQHQWFYPPNYIQHNGTRNSNEYSETTETSGTHQTDQSASVYECQNSASDIARCSTPELITALASINNEKSDEKNERCATPYFVDQMPAINPTVTKPSRTRLQTSGIQAETSNNMMYMHLGQYLQDSGYSSDLCMSPVYPYESKFSSKIKGENVSSDEENKENVYTDNGVNVQSCVSGRMANSLFYKEYIDRITCKSSDSGHSVASMLSGMKTLIQSSHISSSNFPSQNNKLLPQNKCAKNISTQNRAQNQENKKVESKKKKLNLENSTEIDSKRSRHNQPLNNNATSTMMQWYETHRDNPYPSKAEKERMAQEGGITVIQVKSWFANKRNRNNNTRPKVQKRQMTERLLGICHQLARDAKQPSLNNADIIQQLSGIIHEMPEHE